MGAFEEAVRELERMEADAMRELMGGKATRLVSLEDALAAAPLAKLCPPGVDPAQAEAWAAAHAERHAVLTQQVAGGMAQLAAATGASGDEWQRMMLSSLAANMLVEGMALGLLVAKGADRGQG